MIDVDLRGPISVLEAFVPPMIDAGRGGHVVNVSSAAGLLGLPWHAAYSAAKFGLRGVSEVLRLRPAPAPDRRQPGLPGRCGDAFGRDGVRSAAIDPEAPELRSCASASPATP